MAIWQDRQIEQAIPLASLSALELYAGIVTDSVKRNAQNLLCSPLCSIIVVVSLVGKRGDRLWL